MCSSLSASHHACNPVIVVYTAEMSGGATFTDFDNTNMVLTKHYANLMMISQAMQWTVEYENMTTGSIVMNPDMFGMVQQGGLLPRLMAMDIAVNDALQQAAWFTTTKHTWHVHGTSKPLNISGTHTPMDIMAMLYSGALKSQGVYSPWEYTPCLVPSSRYHTAWIPNLGESGEKKSSPIPLGVSVLPQDSKIFEGKVGRKKVHLSPWGALSCHRTARFLRGKWGEKKFTYPPGGLCPATGQQDF